VGGSSLLFDGNDYFDITQSSYTGGDFDFGTGDFTIETWIRFDSTYINNYNNIWLPTGPSIPDSKFIRLTWDGRGSTDQWSLYCMAGGSFSYQDSSLAANTWYHIAVSRTSGVIKFFKDGTQLGSDLNNANAMGFYGGLRLGKTYSTWTPAYYFGGWMDDFRVTKGVGRYTSNFTAPTERFKLKVELILSKLNTSAKLAVGTTRMSITESRRFPIRRFPSRRWERMLRVVQLTDFMSTSKS